MQTTPSYLPQPRYLGFLTLAYCMVLIMADWFDPRLIQIFSHTTDAGTLIFPFTFMLSDIITEVYGFQQARRAIWCGFLFNLIFIIYGQIVIHLPSPHYAIAANEKFDALLVMNIRIIFASIISYICAEPLSSLVMSKLKIYFSGKMLPARFVFSTVIASAVDTSLFATLAFYDMMQTHELLIFILTMWVIKVSIEIIGLPISVYITNKLKQRENLDIYDLNTNFNLFSFDVNYKKTDNKYIISSAA